MKCVVVIPQIEDFYYTPHRGSFLGGEIVFNILRQKGYDVEYVCLPNLIKKPKVIPIPKELSYLKEFIIKDETGPFSFFTSYKRFGPSYRDAAEVILINRPQMVFISCFAFCYALSSIYLAQEIKNIAPHVDIVIGGAGASVFPEYFIDTSIFYKVLCGEAEYSLTSFLGIDEIDSPLPAFVKTKETKKVSYYSTYLTRGCPMGCRFCSVPLIHGKRLRCVDENSIYNKVSLIPNNKLVFLNFEDDQILLKSSLFLKVLRNIKKIKPFIFFSCENGIDYRQMDIPLLNELISLGFRQFNFSVGNISSNIARSQKRDVDISKLKLLAIELDKKNIDAIVYFISGFKGEKREDAIKNLVFLARLGKIIRIGLSPFYPIPGIWGLEDKNLFKDKSPLLCCGTSMWPWNGSLLTEDMVTLFRLVRIVNSTKKIQMDDVIKDVVNRCIKEKKLYTFIKNTPYPVEVKRYNREMVKSFFEMWEIN